MNNSITRGIKTVIADVAAVFRDEMRNVFTDTGVVIFFFVVPLFYPLLYSWLYNNEVVKEVPTVIVDDSRSALSREFIRKLDATEGIWVKCYAGSIDEGRLIMMNQQCRAVIHLPSTFSSDIIHGEQTHVSLFADMSGILYYKSSLMALTNVSLAMGSEIQIRKMPNYTDRDDELMTAPLEYEAVPIFNPSGGYGTFLLPAVLMLIIQQTLLLGIGLSAGTVRESNRFKSLVPLTPHYEGSTHIVVGKSLCYFLIYIVMASYITMAVPDIFGFLQLAGFSALMTMLVPYILASIFLGMIVSSLVRYRENIILIIIFTSVPLLFLSGISWPVSSLDSSWKAVSYLFPSTFGINAFVKMNSMGAMPGDVVHELRCLWIQTGVYFLLACLVYWRQYQRSLNAAQSLP